MIVIQELLARAVSESASDVHVVVGLPPLVRIHTVLAPMEGLPEITADHVFGFLRDLLTEAQRKQLHERRDLDFSAVLPSGIRFRVNAHFQRGAPAMAFRAIPGKVPALESLNLPEVVREFADTDQGLVLVTGETGSGKSTTLASMIDHINHRCRHHIITLEDPIEYFLPSDLSVIEQREVGIDVPDFSAGLRHVLRQDPDVILIGEMRDLETISTALTAAETGHLVLSTLHTNDAASTVERIIDIFPADPAEPGPLDAGQHPEGRGVPAAVSAGGPAGDGAGGRGPGLDARRAELHPREPHLRNPEHHRNQPGPRHEPLRRVAEAAVLQRHDQPRGRPVVRPDARTVAAGAGRIGDAMNTYRYQMRRSNGQVLAGVLKAPTQLAAAQQVRDLGGTVVQIVRVGDDLKARASLLERLGLSSGVSGKDLLAFTSQLACMSKAGIGVTVALDSIGEQITAPRMRTICDMLKRDVEAGRQFSEALQRFPRVFSPLYINMVRASEMAGSFGHMLERITEYQTQQMETKRQVIGAMVYPIIIVCMAIMTTVFMLTFVLPRFMVLFAGKEEILPLPTKMLMAMSASMCGYWFVYLGVVAAAATGIILFIRTETGRQYWDLAKLKIPILSKLCHALYLSRGLKTMGELVNAGVPVLDTIAITAEVSGNVHYARIWNRVHLAVRKGQRIAPTLAQSSYIPPSVTQMISAGEDTGSLAEILGDVSDFYDKQLKATIKTVTAAIEPLMIILMGGIVAFIAASILLPIFKMSQLVK